MAPPLLSPVLWWLLGALTLAGAMIAVWAWSLDRHRHQRRCPRCWYDLSASGESRRCPECGHEAQSEKALFRPRRRRRLAAAGLLVAVAGPAWFGSHFAISRGWHYALLPKWTTLQEQTIAGVRVQIMEVRNPQAPDWGRVARLSIDGEVKHEIPGFYFSIGSQSRVSGGAVFGIGDDVTGEGMPDIVITHDNGGTGCFMETYVFSVEAGPPPVVNLMAKLDDCGGFEDVDGDGRPEFVVLDRTFKHRWTSGAGSPMPRVVLSWSGSQFAVNQKLTRQPAPPLSECVARVRQAHASSGAQYLVSEPEGLDGPGPTWLEPLLGDYFPLVYGGNAVQADQLLDAIWPQDTEAGRQDFEKAREQLHAALSESPYAADIRRLNDSDR